MEGLAESTAFPVTEPANALTLTARSNAPRIFFIKTFPFVYCGKELALPHRPTTMWAAGFVDAHCCQSPAFGSVDTYSSFP
jgi:hypothetical protein